MPLYRLEAFQFRNLENVRIELDAGLQFIYGDNASGKTSLLDAINVLCSARSFLGASPRKMQQFGTTEFSLNGMVSQEEELFLPIQYRWQSNQVRLNLGNKQVRRSSEYASLQPVQAVTPVSYRLLDDSPDVRRRFMDWGVFHVKHDYAGIWHRFQRSLAQRNAMLVSGKDPHTLSAWSQEYVRLAESLDKYRADYVELLVTQVKRYIQAFLPDSCLDIRYQRGWDAARSLDEVLSSNFQRDQERHFTYHGPQRAELVLKLDGVLVRDSASRGQKKLITFAIYLAQANLQRELGRHSGILLVDDLPSELDQEHISLVMDILRSISMQVVISCIDISRLPRKHRYSDKMFHVKQGRVKEVLQ